MRSPYLVTKNDGQEEKIEKVEVLPPIVEPCLPEKTQVDTENQVTRLPEVTELPEIPTTTTFVAVTSTRLPEVTQVTELVDGSNIEKSAPITEREKTGAVTSQMATDESFKVGDRVIWSKCPGHFAWANPFTITAIQNEMAGLDIVEKPVPLVQLRRVV